MVPLVGMVKQAWCVKNSCSALSVFIGKMTFAPYETGSDLLFDYNKLPDWCGNCL